MRIALVVPGGVDRSGELRVIPAILALLKQLASRSEVHVFALRQERQPGHWLLNGAHIHNIGEPLTRSRCLLEIVRLHRRRRFDVVQSIFSSSCGLVVVMAGRMLDLPSVVHVAGGELAALHDIGYGGARKLHTRARERWVLRNAAVVTAASAPIVGQVARLGVLARRVPLGVDLEAWPVRKPEPRDSSKELRLIHVASLNRVKDQATLLHAARFLQDAGIRFHLDVVGDDTLGGSVQSLAQTLALAPRVTFHGFLAQRQLHRLMAQAHVNLVSSRHEAGPMVLLEAAVAGVPTVGTEVGHIAEWAPGAALAVPVRDPAGLAAGVLRLLQDEAFRLDLAREAQARAIACDAKYTASCYEQIYGSERAALTE